MTGVDRCPLCGTTAYGEPVHGDYVACACGLVYAPGRMFESPSTVPDGWRVRAAQIAVELPKHATCCPSVEELAALLQAGPVYVETPNTREPALSLSHFFRSRLPCYYEPQTLAIAAIMAGASDMAIDEQAGSICAVLIPGDPRRTYAEALEIFGAPPPADVASRMAHAFDRKVEAMGEIVDGPCFLCGAARRAWRTAAICTECSTLTALSQPPVLDELAVSFSSAPPDTERGMLAPSMRSTSPDDCERIVTAQGYMLDDPGWIAALIMAGADQCTLSKRLGALHVSGIAKGVPRRKGIAEAREIVSHPFREGRHTLAVWSLGPPTASRFELWMAGEDEDDVEMLRADARRMHEVATAAIGAVEAIASFAEKTSDDDWHEDAELRGMRMGRAAALIEVFEMATAASASLLGRAMR